VSTDATDTSSYFLLGADSTGEDNRITFTGKPSGIPVVVRNSVDDFESLNERLGPQAGAVEVSIGLTPVGDTDQDSGLFLREQRPADGDATQGGSEVVVDEQIAEISFEAYDGTTWLTDWDTRVGQRRIPSMVRVSYRLEDEEDETRTFVVRLPYSDVTADNPYVAEAAQGGTTP
jgi:hypothetical protein